MFHSKELELLHKILTTQEKTYDLINSRFRTMHIKFRITKHHTSFVHERKLDMDLGLVLTPTAGALGVPVEKKADGSDFVYDPAAIKWSVQDGSVVSFVQNADGTAQFKPLAVGSTQVGVVDTATGASKVVLATVTAAEQPNVMDINFTNVTV